VVFQVFDALGDTFDLDRVAHGRRFWWERRMAALWNIRVVLDGQKVLLQVVRDTNLQQRVRLRDHALDFNGIGNRRASLDGGFLVTFFVEVIRFERVEYVINGGRRRRCDVAVILNLRFVVPTLMERNFDGGPILADDLNDASNVDIL